MAQSLKTHAETREAIQQYVSKMTIKYPRVQPQPPNTQIFEFGWVLSYFTNNTGAFLTIIMIVVGSMFGVVIPGHKQTAFSTYHVLSTNQVKHLRWIQFLQKQVGYPFAIFRVIFLVFISINVLGGIVAVCSSPMPPSPHMSQETASPLSLRVFMGIAILGMPLMIIIFGGKLVNYLRSQGMPPGSNDDFRHRMLYLRNCSQIKSGEVVIAGTLKRFRSDLSL